MDILLYSNIRDMRFNIDYIVGLKTLQRDDVTVEQVRWACKFDTVHVGNMVADAFKLDKNILGKCPDYASLCTDSNAIREIGKVPILVDALVDDIHSNLDILDILQNNEQLALGYLQDEGFLRKVCSSKATIVELVKKQSYCDVVKATINNHRVTIRATLERENATYTDVRIGNGAGTWDYEINKPNLLMAWQCDDDGDTDFSFYSGEGTHRVAYVPRHSGPLVVDHIICLRGAKLVGTGSTIGNALFRFYNFS